MRRLRLQGGPSGECDYCHGPLSTRYRKRDEWKWCSSHATQGCGACGRPCPPTDDRWTYCAVCTETIATDPLVVQRRCRQVLAFMDEIGLGVDYPVDVAEMSASDLKDVMGSDNVLGFARWSRPSPSAKPRIEIHLRERMPRWKMLATLAHEYGHAYLFARDVVRLPSVLSEGFSEYVEYRFLVRFAPDHVQRRFLNGSHARDDEYGEGFRVVATKIHQLGLERVVELLSATPQDFRAFEM